MCKIQILKTAITFNGEIVIYKKRIYLIFKVPVAVDRPYAVPVDRPVVVDRPYPVVQHVNINIPSRSLFLLTA